MAGKVNEIWIGSEHEVEEAFASPRVTVQQCYAIHRADAYIKSMLQQNGIKAPIKIMDEKSMSAMSRQKGTQFWIQVTLSMDETIEDFTEDAPTPDLVLVLDQIQDPQNLGALIRSAHFFGAKMVLMPKDNTCPITDVVSRASAGAVFSLPIVRATNLVREINKLKDLGLYMISLSPESREPLHTKDFKNDLVGLVIGSEGSGVRRLVEETCDFKCSLTQNKGRDSLNASVAGGIALFEISRQKARV
jgi:23S rRNA (guanosine2251-2'-O)-methyltransferase